MYPAHTPGVTRRALWLFLMLLLLPATLVAQKEHQRWYFGKQKGLSFATDPPTILTDGYMTTSEACASFCDPVTGDLLFYTNGVQVWNRNHNYLATGLFGGTSTSQTLIVPDPGNAARYYIFSLDAWEFATAPNGLWYSVVDMTGSGGFGATTTKNVQLLPDASEKITAVRHANGRDVWVIAHQIDGDEFYAFLLGASGIDPAPVVSRAGTPLQGRSVDNGGSVAGCLKASPNGRSLMMTSFNGIAELFSFDPASGIVSPAMQILGYDLDRAAYGASFSPNGRRVYISTRTAIVQFSLDAGSPQAIIASKYSIPQSYIRNIQLGPDGRIYAAPTALGWLSVIRDPNSVGAGCDYVEDYLHIGNSSQLSLPNDADALGSRPLPHAVIEAPGTRVCLGQGITFDASGSTSASDHEWIFDGGSPGTSTSKAVRVTFATPGSHEITLIVTNGFTSDTARLRIDVVAPPSLAISKDTTICLGGCASLSAVATGGSGALASAWSPSAGLSCPGCPTITVCPTRTTRYTVTVTDTLGCQVTDSVTVTVDTCLAMSEINLSAPSICVGEAVDVDAGGSIGATLAWSFPGGVPASSAERSVHVRYPSSGTFTIMLVARDRDAVDTVRRTITVVAPPELDMGASMEICHGRSVRLRPKVTSTEPLTYSWSPAAGLDCIDCASPSARPDATTTYTLTARTPEGCSTTGTITLTVTHARLVDAGNDIMICHGTSGRLSAATDPARGPFTYSWTPTDGLSCADCADPMAAPGGTTRYRVSVTAAEGCVDEDSVTVAVVEPTRATVSVPKETTVSLGAPLSIPVRIDEGLGGLPIEALGFSLDYNPDIMRFRPRTDAADLVRGTLLSGWACSVVEEIPGTLRLLLTPPAPVLVEQGGTILNIPFITFISAGKDRASAISTLHPMLTPIGAHCVDIGTTAGSVEIQICGLEFRMIDGLAARYALDGIRPNPFNPEAEIDFSIGLDGPTRVQILDARGSVAATLLDDALDAGAYVLRWDASRFSGGLYYCIITSGAWRRVEPMMLVK